MFIIIALVVLNPSCTIELPRKHFLKNWKKRKEKKKAMLGPCPGPVENSSLGVHVACVVVSFEIILVIQMHKGWGGKGKNHILLKRNPQSFFHKCLPLKRCIVLCNTCIWQILVQVYEFNYILKIKHVYGIINDMCHL